MQLDHIRCFNCSAFGHRARQCPSLTKQISMLQSIMDEQDKAEGARPSKADSKSKSSWRRKGNSPAKSDEFEAELGPNVSGAETA